MELILTAAVIVVLCIILGAKLSFLIIAALALIGLIYAASLLMLCFFFIRMLFSKRYKAVFSRIGKSPKSSFNVAYYTIKGEDYPNIFPEEGFFRSKLYRTDKYCTVMLARNKKFVFDKFSCATCTIGFILGIISSAAAVIILYQI